MPTQEQIAQKKHSGYDHVDTTALAEADAQRAPRHSDAVTHSDEVLADIDEALQGLDTSLATSYRQAGGE